MSGARAVSRIRLARRSEREEEDFLRKEERKREPPDLPALRIAASHSAAGSPAGDPPAPRLGPFEEIFSSSFLSPTPKQTRTSALAPASAARATTWETSRT